MRCHHHIPHIKMDQLKDSGGPFLKWEGVCYVKRDSQRYNKIMLFNMKFTFVTDVTVTELKLPHTAC